MHRFLVLVAMVALTGHAPAQGPAARGLLELVPRQADLVLVVDRPRQLIESLGSLSPVKQLMQFEAVREALDSTKTRQFRSLVAHVERQMGKPWPELLDSVAGRGICLAARPDGNRTPVLLVVQGRDEGLMKRALELLADAAGQGAEGMGKPIRFESADRKDVVAYRFDKNFYGAVLGPNLLLANNREAIRAAIDLYADGPKQSFAALDPVKRAAASIPADALGWMIARTERLHERPEAKEAYQYPKGDVLQLVLFQGLVDAIGKAPFVAGSLRVSPEGTRTTIHLPAGRDATPAGLALHLPPVGTPGSLPLLEPKDTLMSWSFYLDLGRLWSDRANLLTGKTRQDIEKAEKDLGRFLGGRRLSEVLTGIGPHHRLVVAHQSNPGYRRRPDQLQPAFAFVSAVRDDTYPKAMNAILRTTALLAGSPIGLKYKEEQVGDVKLVTYRFNEGAEVDDPSGVRFNFSPCFAQVGDSFVVASTVELGRELIPILRRPSASGSPATSRFCIYSGGGSTVLRSFEDQIATQTILDQATTAEAARREVDKAFDWVRQLGKFEIAVEYRTSDMTIEIRHDMGRPGDRP